MRTYIHFSTFIHRRRWHVWYDEIQYPTVLPSLVSRRFPADYPSPLSALLISPAYFFFAKRPPSPVSPRLVSLFPSFSPSSNSFTDTHVDVHPSIEIRSNRPGVRNHFATDSRPISHQFSFLLRATWILSISWLFISSRHLYICVRNQLISVCYRLIHYFPSATLQFVARLACRLSNSSLQN